MTHQIRTPRRSAAHPAPPARPDPRRRGRASALPVDFNWRWVSLGLALIIFMILVFVYASPLFVITNAQISGARYTPVQEIFTLSGTEGRHILTIDPDSVRQRLLTSPGISSAQVILGWPAQVILVVREREPALIWEQGGQLYWVDVNGNLMEVRQDVPFLVRVVNEGEAIPFRCPGPDCPGGSGLVAIDPAVVLGAQQLKTLRSNIDMLYYDSAHGLSYQDGRGWRGYFGIGTDMNRKLAVYETLVNNLLSRGIQPARIDVANPSAPYYSTAP